MQGCAEIQEDKRNRLTQLMIMTLTMRLFIGAVNGGDQDWVEPVDFGNVEEVFKLVPSVTYCQKQCMTKSQLCCHPQQD